MRRDARIERFGHKPVHSRTMLWVGVAVLTLAVDAALAWLAALGWTASFFGAVSN